jgi:hypothetical protein
MNALILLSALALVVSSAQLHRRVADCNQIYRGQAICFFKTQYRCQQVDRQNNRYLYDWVRDPCAPGMVCKVQDNGWGACQFPQ